jgi:hypothetical protein
MMPCYRCGTRQADPEQGKASPWRRGVLRAHQVLICPGCAASGALTELDRCADCGGTRLIRRLDQAECLDCGRTRDVSQEPEGPENPEVPGPRAERPGTLADEVASALGRIFG